MERLIQTEEGYKAWCNLEQAYRPVSDFQRNKNSSTGYDYRCRYCNKIRNANPEYTEQERKMSKIILENLGYCTDPESPLSVARQFMIKHNL